MAKYTCKVCAAAFTSYNPNPMFCCQACRSKDMQTDVDLSEIQRLYEGGHTQDEIAATLHVSQKVIFAAMKRNGIKARVAAKRDQWGAANAYWKGDDAGYQALHRRLYAKFGKPTKCGVCGTEAAKNYDYASLTKRYHDITDYAPMCRSCHWKFDGTIRNITDNRRHARDGQNANT